MQLFFLIFDKIVGVYLFNLIGCYRTGAHIVFDHEFGKPVAVNEDDFGIDVGHII